MCVIFVTNFKLRAQPAMRAMQIQYIQSALHYALRAQISARANAVHNKRFAIKMLFVYLHSARSKAPRTMRALYEYEWRI